MVALIKFLEFPDHYKYKQKDINKIKLFAKNMNAKILTTEKDYIKLNQESSDGIKFLEIELIIKNEDDLINFIKKRANEKLVELGYVDLGSYFPFNPKAAANLDWFYHLTGGVTHTDFFATRPTDYSKPTEGEDFEDIW